MLVVLEQFKYIEKNPGLEQFLLQGRVLRPDQRLDQLYRCKLDRLRGVPQETRDHWDLALRDQEDLHGELVLGEQVGEQLEDLDRDVQDVGLQVPCVEL